MLVRILTHHQVMPSYLDFLPLFGNHRHSREQRFSSLRSQLELTSGQTRSLDCLGRSGRRLQLCYNLKSITKRIESNGFKVGEESWSVQQGAFHHQFDAENGNSLWIVTRADQDLKERIQDLTGKTGRIEDRQFQDPQACFKSSLAVHLLLCHWACENWRAYFQWLEDKAEHKVRSTPLGRVRLS